MYYHHNQNISKPSLLLHMFAKRVRGVVGREGERERDFNA
jgi:hypothetical protein